MYNEDDNLLAILGPTNTGKTYLAFEKLFSFSSGIFGFPLRLLARENYDKAVERVGKNNVALVTGEEKIIPHNPKFYCCTVEAMPIEKQVSFEFLTQLIILLFGNKILMKPIQIKLCTVLSVKISLSKLILFNLK